jgi:hypothetical protein
MKRWLMAGILTIVLSIAGIGKPQELSTFPKLDETKAVGVGILSCPNAQILITQYDYENNITFVSYESDKGLLFAISKWVNEEYVGVYILRSKKFVAFYKASEDAKTPKACAALTDATQDSKTL